MAFGFLSLLLLAIFVVGADVVASDKIFVIVKKDYIAFISVQKLSPSSSDWIVCFGDISAAVFAPLPIWMLIGTRRYYVSMFNVHLSRGRRVSVSVCVSVLWRSYHLKIIKLRLCIECYDPCTLAHTHTPT